MPGPMASWSACRRPFSASIGALVFRRHYFTRRATLERSLRGFLQFYNFERPHHGYRVRGRTPATLFHGAVAVAR